MRLFAIAAVALTLGLAGSAQAAKQDFTLVNKTGDTISQVYVSAASTRSWEEDVMGSDTLGDDEEVDISFERGERGCIYDLKVVYSDGDSAEWDRLNLCTLHRIALYWDRKAGTTRAITQ